MKWSDHLTLYSAIFFLSLNGLFANGIPLDPGSITQVRSIFALIALGLFIKLRQRSFALGNKKNIGMVYLVGALMGLHWWTLFHAMQSSSVAIGMLSLFTFPIMTALLEPWFTGKKIQFLDIILCCIVFIGLLIIASEHLSNQQPTSTEVIYGILSGILSGVCFSLRNLLLKYRCPQVSSDTLMLHQLVIILLLMTPFIDVSALQSLEKHYWFYLIILGIVNTAIAHTLLVKSYKAFAAKTVAMVGCSQPVFSGLVAWLILHEQPSLYTIIGGAIILSVAIYESTRTAT